MSRLVSELTGVDLAIWVARNDPRCEGITWTREGENWIGYGTLGSCADEFACAIITDAHAIQQIKLRKKYNADVYAPLTDWNYAGPIIQRGNIGISPPTSPVRRCGGPNAGMGQSGVWTACTWTAGADGRRSFGMHDTSPLIAAMRCYVRSIYGETVPDEVVL